VCERCGKEIDVERLEVVPATRFCADCQREVEE
jgi:RNA polymerase-binding transcription factor DksA